MHSRPSISPLVFLALVFCALLPLHSADKSDSASRIIQYRGPMPLLDQKLWGSQVKLKFELYRSPEGGTPFWKETRQVTVQTNGWVKIDLGTSVQLPDEAFMTAFRFLSIWHEGVEFTPRKQVASLAYVASPEGSIYIPSYPTNKIAPTDQLALGPMHRTGPLEVETNPRLPQTWLSAVKTAGELGVRLPTFEEWYSIYESNLNSKIQAMEGHYEWVIPWVYEPSIHGRLHELYRGKPVACYYEELSPMNRYPYRLVKEVAPGP